MTARTPWVNDPRDDDIVGEQMMVNICGGREELVAITVADRRHQLWRELVGTCADFLAHRGSESELREIVELVIAGRRQQIEKHPHLAGLPILRRASGSPRRT